MDSSLQRRSILLIVIIALAVTAYCYGFADGARLIVFELALGWLVFLWRVVPEINVRVDGVLIFVLSSVFFSLMLHWILAWFFTNYPSHGSVSTERKTWRFKWSVMIVLGIELLFVAGIGATGIAHQSVWLIRDTKPMFGRSFYDGYRSTGPRTETLNQMKSNMLDLDNFHSVSRTLPRNSKEHSWITEALLYSSYCAETDQIDMSQPWDSPRNRKPFKKPNPLYLNPRLVFDSVYDDDGYALSHFAGNERIFSSKRELKIRDLSDLSHTIMIGEINSGFSPWGKPGNVRDVTAPINSSEGFGEVSSGGIAVAFSDGSVKFINPKIDRDVYHSYAGEWIE